MENTTFLTVKPGCGGRTWTSDLRVMSPTSYQLLHPAISYQIIILQYWCRRPGSNRYGYHYPQDFKSWASANSATPAGKKLAPRVGLEPTAYRLTAGCSTIELPRITSFIISTTSMIIDYVMLFCQYIFYNFYRLESFFLWFEFWKQVLLCHFTTIQKHFSIIHKFIYSDSYSDDFRHLYIYFSYLRI